MSEQWLIEQRNVLLGRVIELEAEIETLRAASSRLRVALEMYGRHKPGCSHNPADLSQRCLCGYHAALAAAGDTDDDDGLTPIEWQRT
jgi:hypothetical protein